jgi:probable HAF family extracellular repeat protein
MVAYAERRPHAAVWENAVPSDLGTLGGTSSFGVAINEVGQIVGFGFTASGWEHAFIWENGAMRDLGTLFGGSGSSLAFAINGRGQVVGQSQLYPAYVYHAFIWENGVMTDLGDLGGGWARALFINNHDQVVGESRTPDGSLHVFFWEDGSINVSEPESASEPACCASKAAAAQGSARLRGEGFGNGEGREALAGSSPGGERPTDHKGARRCGHEQVVCTLTSSGHSRPGAWDAGSKATSPRVSRVVDSPRRLGAAA